MEDEFNNNFTAKHLSKYFFLFAERSDDVIWVRSPDYMKQIYTNPVFETIWGRSCKTLEESPEKWVTFLHPDDRLRLEKSINERNPRVSPSDTFIEIYRIVRPDNEIRWIKDKSFPLFDENNKLIAFAGIAQDITESINKTTQLKKAKKEAEAGNLAKTEFLENMRHSIRTPITGLLGLCDMIIQKSSQPEIIEYAEYQKAGINALLYIHNNVLEAVRIADGVVPYRSDKFYFKELIAHIENLARPVAIQKGIKLIIEQDASIPDVIVSDLQRLFRVLFELVGNALTFTIKGSIKIKIKLIQCNKDKRQAVIRVNVVDTGIGIPSEQCDEIFTTFKRLTPACEGKYQGIGTGLSTAREYIHDIGGEIYLVESKVGKGSSFMCQFPVTLSLIQDNIGAITDFTHLQSSTRFDSIESMPKPAVVPAVNDPIASDIHILVVEDDPITAKSIEALLNSHECNVDIAENGKSALELSGATHYDLIFMDVGLPDISGDEITRRIRAMEYDGEMRVPILALSAHIDVKGKMNCMKSGMNAIFIKPILPDKIGLILQTFIPKYVSKKSFAPATLAARYNDTPADQFHIEGKAIDIPLGADIMAETETKSREMIDMYHERISKELPTLEAAYAKKDWEAIQGLAHRMKGATSYLGIPRLRQACSVLEQSIQTSCTENYEALYQQLLTEIANFKRAYKALTPLGAD